MMRTSDALWEVFKATGHIGAYLLYKEYINRENKFKGTADEPCYGCRDSIRAE